MKQLLFGLLLFSSVANAFDPGCELAPNTQYNGKCSVSHIAYSCEIIDPRIPPTSVQVVGYCSGFWGNRAPLSPPNINDIPRNQCGSIINVDSLSVGESIDVVGTQERLTYFSDRVIGRKTDYNFYIPLVVGTPDPNISGIRVVIRLLNRTITQDFIPSPDLKYEFNWDGKDENGNTVSGATNVQAEITQTYFSPKFDVPIKFSFQLGAWKAKLIGLGGWTLSSHHFYDPIGKKIYLGTGSIRLADGIPYSLVNGKVTTVGGNQGFMVGEPGGNEVYLFNLSGRHLETRSIKSGAILKTFQYSLSGELEGITDSFGNMINITKPAATTVNITSPRGQVTRLTLNANGYATSIRDPQNRNHVMTYVNAEGLLKTYKKPSGSMNTFSYSLDGKLSRDEHSGGAFFEFINQVISQTDRIITMKTAEGRSTKFSISAQPISNIFSRTEQAPSGAVSSLAYYPASAISAQTFGGSTIYESFTPDLRFLSTFPRATSTQVISGNQNNLVNSSIQSNYQSTDVLNLSSETTTTTMNGKVWKQVYDGSNRKMSFVSPLNRAHFIRYNNVDQVIESQNSSEAPTSFNYDVQGRLSTIEQSGRFAELTYDSFDRVSSFKNALNQVTTFAYDAGNRVTAQTLADGRIMRYSYDVNGNLSGVKPAGTPWHTFTYNAYDLIANYVAPLVGVVTQTSYEYNLDKQLKKITRPDGSEVNFNYGATTGLLNSIQTAEGLYSRQYTFGDQLTQISAPSGTILNTTYNGDLIDGHKTNYSATIYGQVSYIYQNLLMKKISIQTNLSALKEFNIEYDNDLLPVQVGDLQISRDVLSGRVSSTTLDQVREQFQYDPVFGEISSYEASYGSTVILREVYTRDNLGRLSAKVVTTSSGSYALGYIYDVTGRLIQVLKDGALIRTYKYDPNSNRLFVEENGRRVRGTYDDQDRMLTYGAREYAYSLNGDRSIRYVEGKPNRIEYAYNSLGALDKAIRTTLNSSTQVTTTDTFDYVNDGMGRRLERKKNGTLTERYLYDENGRLIAELNVNGAVVSYFIYANRFDVPDYMIRANVKYKLIHDHFGSVRFVVNSLTGAIKSMMEYDEFGQLEPDPIAVSFQPFGFAGGIYDQATRLVRFGARDYDPLTGRWLSKDPILFEGGDTNLYGYVLQDPINKIDPTGLSELDPVIVPDPDRDPLRDILDELNRRVREERERRRQRCLLNPNSEECKPPPPRQPTNPAGGVRGQCDGQSRAG